MKAKRVFYSILLVLFILVLLADLGLWFFVPDAAAVTDAIEGFSFTPSGGKDISEGMTVPSGGIFPGGMASSRSSEESGSSDRRRSRRSTENAETQAAPAPETATERSELTELPAVLTNLLPLAQKVRPYRLHILIGAIAGMALCILRLICINRKIRQQEAQETESVASLRRVALWPAMLLLLSALVLVVFLFPVNEEEKAEDGAVANVQLLSGTMTEKTLTSLIQSAGSLTEQEAVSLTLPASVSVASACVKNGDTVTAGQIVAKADETSVMKAIASVHEVLNDIDSQLQEAHEAKGGSSLTAPVTGTVKAVYAEVGRTALDVMNDHGALMLLSLDGRMAVRIPATDRLTMGSAVTVSLSDGTELAGEVTFLEEGVATVTVVDRGYNIGEYVSVRDENGALLGSGSLYVHKALNITGYLGTITRIYRQEGSTAYAGTTLIGLSNTADLGKYQDLLQQRAKYEAELKTLFELYETCYIHAPCDGVIAGLSDDLSYAPLADLVAGLTVRQLATGPADAEPTEFYNYIAEVAAIDGSWISWIKGGQADDLTSYASLPSLVGSQTGEYTIPGSTPIYLLRDGWNPISVADILPGDTILFTFDANGSLVWVIVEHTAASATPSPTPTLTPSPTPDGSSNPSGTLRPGESPSPSDSPGQGGGRPGGARISFGGGAASATKKPAYTIAQKELCTVTPQEKMLITVPIDELDILSLSLGQAADLFLDALPTTGFTATVTKIDHEGENSGGNTKFSVTLALDRGPQLYPGMNGTVCFPRNKAKTVPAVPLAALAEEGDRTVIYTSYDPDTDQLLSPVEVRTGISDGTYVEIISGLAPGTSYYYRYADSISYVTE